MKEISRWFLLRRLAVSSDSPVRYGVRWKMRNHPPTVTKPPSTRRLARYDFAGGKVIQFDLAVLSHFSYMLISDGECLVVDPGRDIETYVNTAQKENCTIKAVYLTHSHADFVAGHIEFARQLNVPIYISVHANAEYEHQPISDGNSIDIGQAVVRILETPGHTPDCTCGVLFRRAGAAEAADDVHGRHALRGQCRPARFAG